MGATNRPDLIDPALLRPGRFDDMVYVPIPDRAARLEIFRAHTRKMALDASVSLDRLADVTDHFTGADIAGVCMKAGLLALRENVEARAVTMAHLLAAIEDTVPSVTDEMQREYQKIAQKIRQDAARIGFAPAARR
jgi:transitional endoplasmic reticulum ATPase